MMALAVRDEMRYHAAFHTTFPDAIPAQRYGAFMIQTQLPWQDRFTEPTPESLRGSLPEESILFLDRIRQTLLGHKGVSEKVGWYGINWCWSIEYRMGRKNDLMAVLVPSPTDLQLAIPIEPSFVNALPYRRLKRSIRDGLDLARAPFDTRWAVWSINQAHMLDDLDELLNRWDKHLRDGSTAEGRTASSRAAG